ncbi:hypothetical protein LTR84_010872 [Exophiala bonariae]|uniref:Uncharacterized protein n=1 Tax=Exophiala bonariae TaxID=1690606 RepID=A0AAV9NL97_9EURO|nr:hypothetical protein LTR84_010872 [Exophiala bonariae]
MASAATPHEEPAESLPPPAAAPTPQDQTSPTQLYTAISRYPFGSDTEYQSGLAAILGHPSTPTTEAEIAEQHELVLQVQCFYFARKYNTPPVEPAGYAAWLSARGGEGDGQAQSQPQPQQDRAGPSTGVADAIPPTQTASSVPPASASVEPPSQSQTQTTPSTAQAADDEPPPYPNSFAAIVDLITRNIPVPGIEEIPTTVLELGSSKVDKTPRRRKPWEKDGAGADGGGEGGETQGQEGVVASSSTVVDGAKREGGIAGDDDDDAAHATAAKSVNDGVVDINGHRETGEGVVAILKPNAVPDSGLLSKD